VSLAQVGEFSFILAELGMDLGILPEHGHDLILGGAIISILLIPLAFWLTDRLTPSIEASSRPALPPARLPPEPEVRPRPRRPSPTTA
jgi:CPA2 family monovalent cation:H+ antiporter-2